MNALDWFFITWAAAFVLSMGIAGWAVGSVLDAIEEAILGGDDER